MNADALINRLERTAVSLPALVADVPIDEARWKPPSGAWSILEVMRHMLDEEVEDFRSRVRSTLETPEQTWRPIDPPGWAVARRYNEDDLPTTAAQFAKERRESIAWLRSLRNPDWTRAHNHPKFGPIPAGMLLASWAAHDALHIRQIAKRMFELASHDAPEFSTRYAGEWGA